MKIEEFYKLLENININTKDKKTNKYKDKYKDKIKNTTNKHNNKSNKNNNIIDIHSTIDDHLLMIINNINNHEDKIKQIFHGYPERMEIDYIINYILLFISNDKYIESKSYNIGYQIIINSYLFYKYHINEYDNDIEDKYSDNKDKYNDNNDKYSDNNDNKDIYDNHSNTNNHINHNNINNTNNHMNNSNMNMLKRIIDYERNNIEDIIIFYRNNKNKKNLEITVVCIMIIKLNRKYLYEDNKNIINNKFNNEEINNIVSFLNSNRNINEYLNDNNIDDNNITENQDDNRYNGNNNITENKDNIDENKNIKNNKDDNISADGINTTDIILDVNFLFKVLRKVMDRKIISMENLTNICLSDTIVEVDKSGNKFLFSPRIIDNVNKCNNKDCNAKNGLGNLCKCKMKSKRKMIFR